MIGYLGYRAARGQWRSYRKSSKQPGGPWTFTAALFCVLPFTVLWMLVAPFRHQGLTFLVLAGVNVILVALAAAPAVSRAVLEQRVTSRYARAAARKSGEGSAQAMLERAALLEELTAQRQVLQGRARLQDPAAERERRVTDLLSVPCPVPSCEAPEAVPCAMGIGIPFAIVRKVPLALCHLVRMHDAVRYGNASRDDILAQFDNDVPEGVL